MRVGFIYNPTSGKGKIVKHLTYIEEAFKSEGHELDKLETKGPGDAKVIASTNNQLYDMYVVAGGDGTLSEVVNGLMMVDKRPKIGYIPTGTTNDVGHMLGISRNIKNALRLILKQGVVRKMDISKINDTYFTYAAATGKFTSASYDVKKIDKKRFGHLAYVYRGFQDAFVDYKMPLEIKHDGGTLIDTFGLILLLNGPRVGGVTLFLMKKSKLNDGMIEAKVFKRKQWMTLFSVLSFFTFGGFSSHNVQTLKSSFYDIKTNEKIEWNTDGEQTEKGSIHVSVEKEAVEIIVSKRASKYLF